MLAFQSYRIKLFTKNQFTLVGKFSCKKNAPNKSGHSKLFV
jgi:hypothetical protein